MNGLYAEKGFGSLNTSVEKINVGLRRGKFEFAVSGSLYSTDGPKFTNHRKKKIDPGKDSVTNLRSFFYKGNLACATILAVTCNTF